MINPASSTETSEQQAEILSKLTEIVKDSSEQNRNFFIAYLSLLIYVQAIIFSTTDLQLLVSTEVFTLPIVDLKVPLVGFYVVVPIFIIALHFNFLQNLESHHYKLMRWKQAHLNGIIPRSSIYPFLFDYAILEDKSQLQFWVSWVNNLLCYNFAPITLGLLLIRFSDSQEFAITAWHYMFFVFDIYLVWKLRLAMKDNEQSTPPTVSSRWWLRSWEFCTHGFHYRLRGLFGLLILFETLFTGLIGWTSDDHFVRYVQPWVQPIGINRSIPIEWLLPRIAIDPNNIIWKPDSKELEDAAKLAGYGDDWVKYFNEQGKGFSPAPDSLRLVWLSSQNLPRAWLRKKRLQGANLWHVQLQGADLWRAKLQGADLSEAQLQDADLFIAQLQNTNLSDAQLQRANLSDAQLQGANLSRVQLQDAVLWRAKLQGANLSEAQLQDADLSDAQLQNTNLSDTQLQEANLSNAQLQVANLSRVQLQGADLWKAQLQGADLSEAQLQGADLSEAQLQGVILYETVVLGALNTQKTVVFGIKGKKGLFKRKETDWKELKKLADTIPNAKKQEQYLKRIETAQVAEESEQASIVEQNWYYAPKEIAQTALPSVCSADNEKTRLTATKAFRHQYFSLQTIDSEKQNPDYPDLLKNIDYDLCTLKECADLRENIKELDCKSSMKNLNRRVSRTLG